MIRRECWLDDASDDAVGRLSVVNYVMSSRLALYDGVRLRGIENHMAMAYFVKTRKRHKLLML